MVPEKGHKMVAVVCGFAAVSGCYLMAAFCFLVVLEVPLLLPLSVVPV